MKMSTEGREHSTLRATAASIACRALEKSRYGRFGRLVVKTNRALLSTLGRLLRISTAASESGISCGSPFFVRAAGIAQVRNSRSISLHDPSAISSRRRAGQEQKFADRSERRPELFEGLPCQFNLGVIKDTVAARLRRRGALRHRRGRDQVAV